MDQQPVNPTPPPPPAPETSTPTVPAPQATPPAPGAPIAPTPPATPPSSNASTKYIIVGLSILALILLFAVGFLYYRNLQNRIIPTPAPTSTAEPTATSTAAPTALPTIPPDWKVYEFESIKMTLQAPPNLQVIENSQGSTTAMAIYIQNYGFNSPPPMTNPYQLYILYQWEPATTEAELEAKKADLVPSSIQEVTVDGYKGFRGQIKGERNRYVTYFLKNGALFSGFTSEPTKENEALSNQIISTIDFKDN